MLITTDDKSRLVVEYIVSYSGRSFNFTLYQNKKAPASFSYRIVENDDFSELKKMFENFVTKNKIKPPSSVDLIISAFDLSAMSLKTKQSLFSSTSKISANYLTDNLGKDYEAKYFIKSEKSSPAKGFITNTFFVCPLDRIIQAETILSKLGLTKFKITFIEEYIKQYLKEKEHVDDTFLIYERREYTCLIPIKDGQPVNIVFSFRDDLASEHPSQLTNLKNMIVSMNYRYDLDESPLDSIITLYGPSNKSSEYSDFSDNITYSGDLNKDELLAKAIPGEYVPQHTKEVKKKESSFDWQKFLGIKKAFTLVEAAVSISIFGIVSAMAGTFLATASNASKNAKRTSLATTYIKTVNEIFHNNPNVETIKALTKYEGEDLLNISHSYYLNEQMDIYEPSSVSYDMTYKVSFKYSISAWSEEGLGMNYTKYILTIESLEDIETSKSYAKEVTLTSVK